MVGDGVRPQYSTTEPCCESERSIRVTFTCGLHWVSICHFRLGTSECATTTTTAHRLPIVRAGTIKKNILSFKRQPYNHSPASRKRSQACSTFSVGGNHRSARVEMRMTTKDGSTRLAKPQMRLRVAKLRQKNGCTRSDGRISRHSRGSTLQCP